MERDGGYAISTIIVVNINGIKKLKAHAIT